MQLKETEMFALMRKSEIEYCRNNITYFIENYCKIEDKDSETLLIPFSLWESQKEVIRSISGHKLNIILKARQLGLSWLALCYCAHRMIFYPGNSVIALSRTETEAVELCRRMNVILSNMPSFVRNLRDYDGGNMLLKASSGEIGLVSPDGRVSVFKAFPSAANSVRSFTANIVLFDEWAFQQQAREIWTSAFPAVNRIGGGQFIGISTMARGTLFEEIFTGENSFNKIFLPWNADPRRTREWYEFTRRQMGTAVVCEYPSSVDDALSVQAGCFFPELREHIHLRPPEKILPAYRRYVALDYGLDMLAAGWYYVDGNGFERGYREVNRSGLIVSEAAQLLLEMNNGENIYRWFAPPDLWNRNRDTGKSTADIFRENGIILTMVSNNREQGWLDLKEHLRAVNLRSEQNGKEYTTARLTFDCGAMPETWRSLKLIQADKQNPRDVADEPHSLTHAADAVRYFVCGRPRTENSALNSAARSGKASAPRKILENIFK